MHRRSFLLSTAAMLMAPGFIYKPDDYIMTVNGAVDANKAGFTLAHEHVLVDFIGANAVSPERYDRKEVFDKVLPYLKQVSALGCKTMVECTPAYLGRDAVLLKELSYASGLHLVTNTGYYGAAGEKFIPKHVYTLSPAQLADIWIEEWRSGIDGSGIRPGFIKTGVDSAPLSVMQEKLMEAACLTHLATGLTIAVHTGNGAAALEESMIIKRYRVRPDAWVWVHAQNEKDLDIHIRLAKAGAWISFDGLNDNNTPAYIHFLKTMKQEKCLHRTLISHDAGWYHVGEKDGGSYRPHTTVFSSFIPLLLENGFTQQDIDQVFITNPFRTLAVKIRKQ